MLKIQECTLLNKSGESEERALRVKQRAVNDKVRALTAKQRAVNGKVRAFAAKQRAVRVYMSARGRTRAFQNKHR